MTRIRILQENPKRDPSESYDRYERYKSARTLEEMLELGGTRADFRHDVKKGFIEVLDGGEDPPSPGRSPAKKKNAAKAEKKSKKREAPAVEGRTAEIDRALDRLAAGVASVVEAVNQGFCPMKVERLYVFVQLRDVSKKDSVRILVNEVRGEGNPETPDALTLERLCDKDEEDLLIQIPRQGQDVGKVAPQIVAEALSQGLVREEDAGRLEAKFAHWLAGVPWKRTVLSPEHRPSRDDWIGWPWEPKVIYDTRDCGLRRGAAAIMPELSILGGAPPENIEFENGQGQLQKLDEDGLKCFVEVWSRDAGPTPDLHAALCRAFDERINQKKKKKESKKAAYGDGDAPVRAL